MQTLRNLSVVSVFVVLLLSVVCTGQADEYHVTPNGDDSNSGQLAKPWKSIHHALDVAEAGDTIFLHAGTWYEPVRFTRSGNANDGPITLARFAEDRVVIDGSRFDKEDVEPLVAIENQSFLVLRGLELCNLATDKLDETPAAIQVSGESRDITVEDCFIHHIANNAKPISNGNGRDAHGIAVFGDAAEPIRNLRIANNLLCDLVLGSSEALVINGNVDGFEVEENELRDCDNIGIDCIGFEETSPNPNTDQARNGKIIANRIYRITTSKNPSYKNERTAAGIYIDGGKDIVVERNEVFECDFGVEVASEKKGKTTESILVQNNLLYRNVYAGLIIGGYNKGSTGSASRCRVINNTFFNNDTEPQGDEWGQIHLQFRVEECVFANNVLMHLIEKDGSNLFVVQWAKSGRENRFRNNIYFGKAQPVWVLGDKWMEELSEFKQHPFVDKSELFADPKFKSLEKSDFRVSNGSPCIDFGDTSLVPKGALDFASQARVVAASVDCGAFEFGNGSSAQKR